MSDRLAGTGDWQGCWFGQRFTPCDHVTCRGEQSDDAPADTDPVGRPGQQQGDQHWPEGTHG